MQHLGTGGVTLRALDIQPSDTLRIPMRKTLTEAKRVPEKVTMKVSITLLVMAKEKQF